MICIHFTPSRKAYTKTSPVTSTGNMERILQEGLRQFSSVAYDPIYPNEPSLQGMYTFAKHGRRNNRKGLWGRNHIIPAAIIFSTDVAHEPGYDGKYHAQVNETIPPKDIIGWFEFDGFQDFVDQFKEVTCGK